MSLVNVKELLRKAKEGRYGVGAFNVGNMEMVLGVIKAAEKNSSPAIMQIAESRLKTSPLHVVGPMMVAAAKAASVPVAVQFDHGHSMELIRQALEIGFSSIMIDASSKPLEENIAIVKEVQKLAAGYGATVEAEVGQLAGDEGEGEKERFYSDPEDVRRLYESTGVDAIALSFGNAHGLYKSQPCLEYSILQRASKVPVPLVLHGGSGISPDDFRKCVAEGISKINIATAGFMAVEAGARQYMEEEEKNYFVLTRLMAESVEKTTSEHMEIFGSIGKA